MHVDEFIDYGRPDRVRHTEKGNLNDNYARWVFLYFRQPAVIQFAIRPFMQSFQLFCDYEGTRWRVVGASRLGDVWLSKNFEREHGYDKRVDVEKCTRFAPMPEYQEIQSDEFSGGRHEPAKN